MVWLHALLWASLVWVAGWEPAWAPLVIAAAFGVWRLVDRDEMPEPWSGVVVALSATVFLVVFGGFRIAAGWLLLAVLSAGVGWVTQGRTAGRPDAADLVAFVGWGVVFTFAPQLIESSFGGWLAPAVLLLAVQHVARIRLDGPSSDEYPAPPIREVRGTLSLEGVVLAGIDSLPRTVPLDLALRAGQSVAILCDDAEDSEALASGLSGRNRPHAGEITIDGVPLEDGPRLIAMVAPGEPFVEGDLVANLGCLSSRPLDRSVQAALFDACSLSEVADSLGNRLIDKEGEPLTVFHRLLVLAARVIPSHYQVMIVVDPVPWANAVRREIWRSAVVRASLGRTAVWITPDRELAYRATEVFELTDGALRSLDP